MVVSYNVVETSIVICVDVRTSVVSSGSIPSDPMGPGLVKQPTYLRMFDSYCLAPLDPSPGDCWEVRSMRYSWEGCVRVV